MRLPPKKRPGNPILAKDWNLLIDALEARTPRPSHGMELVFSSGGFSYRVHRVAAEVPFVPPCPFGGLVPLKSGEETVTGIRGGTVHCGDKNFVIDDKEAPTSDGYWLAYLSVDCEVNRDDDETILLPGVKTGTEPSGIQFANADSGYPNNSNPEAGSGQGTIILPIGWIFVQDGNQQFWPDGCGNFVIEHCSGNLSYHRV
jgi:hypothetical protein